MTATGQGRRRAGVVAATALTALIGTAVLASPASAHTPRWTITCDSVTVDLSMYNPHVTNTVELQDDGKNMLPYNTTFQDSFHFSHKLPPHSSPLPMTLVVSAGDDPDGSRGFSVTKTATAPVCPADSASPTPAPSHSPGRPTATPSTSAVAPAPSPSPSTPGTHLAETGGSSATPVIAGVAAAVVLAGGGLTVLSRRRRASAR